jgi:hypothetical protein
MPRLIDRLLAATKWKAELFNLPLWMFESNAVLQERCAGLREDLRRSTVLVIDNVAKYYFQHHTNPKGRMDGPEEFPQLAPPFPCAFYEYKIEPSMYDVMFNDAEEGRPRLFDTAGVLIRSVDAQEVLNVAPDVACFLEESRPGVSPKWVLIITLFTRRSADRDVYGPSELLMLAIGEDGQATNRLRSRPWGINDKCYDQLSDQRLMELGSPGRAILPAFLATSFLHCRNVTTQEHVPPPKLSKAFQRRHGRPLIQFRTLAIEPMKEVLRREGQVQTSGLKHALHLCRGHFKDYRNSGGLFGKHQGLFWWDMHARGTLDQGAVVKDYAIKLPESGGSLEHR